jgi:putative transposase
MTYSIDFRKKVVENVGSGDTIRGTARLFGLSPWTVQSWCKAKDDLSPKKHGSRQRKINKNDLLQHVKDFPDALLRERATHFNVQINAIWSALRRLKIRKKNDAIRGENVYQKD